MNYHVKMETYYAIQFSFFERKKKLTSISFEAFLRPQIVGSCLVVIFLPFPEIPQRPKSGIGFSKKKKKKKKKKKILIVSIV